MKPPSPQTTLVVVPTYDEVDNVRPLVTGIRQHLTDIHVLFVDDNSADGTLEQIHSLMKDDPERIFLIRRDGKLGLGTAYVAGFRWALARHYEAVIEMDADLSHRAEDLAVIVAELRRHPVVIGSRYIPGGGTVNWGIGRQIISRLGSWYARSVLGLGTRDLTGGFNGWHRAVLERLDVGSIRSEGYTFQIELKYRAFLAGFPLHEIPISFIERRAGQSKMSGGIVFEAIHRVWHLAMQKSHILERMAATCPAPPNTTP